MSDPCTINITGNSNNSKLIIDFAYVYISIT